MSTDNTKEIAKLWADIQVNLQNSILDKCQLEIESRLNIQQRVQQTCQQYLEHHTQSGTEEEIAQLLQIISLLEERTSHQETSITNLENKLEKLEEEILQTRIEHAKHQLDFMEKLASLQQKIIRKLS